MTTPLPARCAYLGNEPLVMSCVNVAEEHGLVTAVIASNHPLVLAFAAEKGIAAIDLGRADVDLAGALRAYDFEVLLSAAYLKIIPPEVLEQAQTCINFHDGPLPRYAGLNVTSWALWNGEPDHAVAWHLMTEQVDRGQIVAGATFRVSTDETANSLNVRCHEAGVESFRHVAAALAAGRLETWPQSEGERRLYRLKDRPIALVDPARPAAALDRAVRALDVGVRTVNTVGAVRLMLGDAAYVVAASERQDAAQPAAAAAVVGTVLSLEGDRLGLATAQGDVVLRLQTPAGAPVDVAELTARHGLARGDLLPSPRPDLVAALEARDPALARHEAWWRGTLAGIEATTPALLADGGAAEWRDLDLGLERSVVAAPGADALIAAAAAWLAGVGGAEQAVVEVTDSNARGVLAELGALVRAPLIGLNLAGERSFDDLRGDAAAGLAAAAAHGPFLADLVGRTPELRERDLTAALALDLAVMPAETVPATGRLRLVQHLDGRLTLRHRLSDDLANRVADQLCALLGATLMAPDAKLADLPLIGSLDAAQLDALNDTAADYDRNVTLDELFRRQAAATPAKPALSCGPRTVTYAELLAEVERLERRLGAAGVWPGDVVGVALERSVEMVAAVLAVLSRGGAYLPLDPGYPVERLQHMVRDSGAKVLVARAKGAARLADAAVAVIDPLADGDAVAAGAASTGRPIHGAEDLAYLIYTSGSTGLPKGVQISHRAVVNFFAGMDAVIGRDPGVWLSVTSLSFDISVLELLWTLTRGFHVVVRRDGGAPPAKSKPVSMSLFYFSAGQAEAGDGYRLLMEGARWADEQGFEAIWTPERHFHDFGAAYPNPSVASAAVAAVTKRIAVRAGSVVLPLHSPVRVAEEWAVVDNLSKGRVGLSFAAGWQPNDFVLNPAAYAGAREALPGMIDTVRRLWRGESVDLPGHDGAPVPVRTLPRPIQSELPVWLTTAGTPSSYESAGRLGLNVLTHLLGQSMEQLRDNIALYRAAWREAGHAGEGQVTLMLHTYLDEDATAAREQARGPLTRYLDTAVGLVRDKASAFPTFAGSGSDADEAFRSLSQEETSQLLDLAAERYLSTSGLFGGVNDAVAMIGKVAAVGVDEVACLIDFGVDAEAVLGSFDLLAEVHRRIAAPADAPVEQPETVGELIARHGVTHLQCTPSLAAMLTADPADRRALGSLRHMMVGGEALPTALANELRQLTPNGRVTNMYGPTETTIWSLTHEIDRPIEAAAPIGRPIANTQVFILDAHGRRLPAGAFGELHIGGDGVAVGYHACAELTAERFVERPGLGRVYATGDIVRLHASGVIEFAGRADNQVKIRGHRIELGEIETALERHPAAAQAVVVARGAPEPALVAFVVPRKGQFVTPDALREHLRGTLPEAMVPSTVVLIDALPLTPNGKVDRKQLPVDAAPAPEQAPAAAVAPANDLEALVAGVWREELGRAVGRNDNFFDIGGHSLLAVKVFRRLITATGADLALTDVFRFPTVQAFAARLDALSAARATQPPAMQPPAPGSDRGAMRRMAMTRRAGGG